MQKVPEAGYNIRGLWVSGLQRRFTLSNLSFPLKVISSLNKSAKIIRRFKPHAVVGVGGYASGPLLYVATKRNIPSLILEQNSYAGLTNKLLAKRVQRICVAYSNMERFFPRDKIVITGNPVRKDISRLRDKKEKARKQFGLNVKKPVLLVLGGSLGAGTLNNSVLHNLQKLIDAGIQVLWQCGERYFEEMSYRLNTKNHNGLVQLHKFIKEMGMAYAAADVVISRAGALSVSELCVAGKSAVFVPSPNVAEDHQTKNARALVEQEAAVLVKDADARAELIDKAITLIHDRPKQEILSRNIKAMAKPEATKDVIEEIIRLIA